MSQSDRHSIPPEPMVPQRLSETSIDLDTSASSLSGDLLTPIQFGADFRTNPLHSDDFTTEITDPLDDNPGLTSRDLALKYCEWGDKSFAAKEYEQAKSAYQIAIRWDSQLAMVHSRLARTYDRLQDYQNALVMWTRAIEVNPTEMNFYYQRVLLHKFFKNYQGVLADCRRILEQFPHHPSARWLNATALVKLEKYQVAIFSLNQHINVYPDDPNGYCYRGICYERLDKFAQGLADFDRAISLQPNQPVIYHARGRTQQRLGDLKAALADFDLAIDYSSKASNQIDPQLAAIYDDRAEIHRCSGNYLEALEDGDRAIKLNPRFADAYFRRGLTYAELGDLELSMLDYSSAIDINPQHVNAYIQRSWIYFRQNEHQLAKVDCQAVKSFTKSCFWSNYMLGVIDSLYGSRHEAIASFSKAIEISPNYVSARYHRGILYHELGNIPKAMVDFKGAQSIQLHGLERLIDRDETGFYAEGLALYYLGKPEAARTVLILGGLSAKRFNNPSFYQFILFNLDLLGLASGALS
jgi:tetratricopeptide (TPR) repeat protein